MQGHSTNFGAGHKQQHTLAGEVCFEGVTLHKGFPGKLIIKPALANHGIVFKRIDVESATNLVKARWDSVSDTALCTTVSNESGISVSTIEHLMAFAGCAIDNALVEVVPEIPIMDGRRPFVDMFEKVGVYQQKAGRKYIKILKPIKILENDACIELSPAKNFSIDFEIDFDSEAIKDTSFNISC